MVLLMLEARPASKKAKAPATRPITTVGNFMTRSCVDGGRVLPQLYYFL